MTITAFIDESGVERLRGTLDPAPGGSSLPANVTWDEDALIVNDDAAQPVFRLKTLISAGTQMAVRMAAFFTAAVTFYNDNGDPLIETDPLGDSGNGTVGFYGTSPAAQPAVNGDAQALADALAGLGLLAASPVVTTPTLDDVLTEGADVGANNIEGAGGTLILSTSTVLQAVPGSDVLVQTTGVGSVSVTADSGASGIAAFAAGVDIFGPALGFFGASRVPQPSAVPDASGGAIIDAEARTAINDLLARLRLLGLIDT